MLTVEDDRLSLSAACRSSGKERQSATWIVLGQPLPAAKGWGSVQTVLRKRIRKSAKTCAAVSYQPLFREPHSGFWSVPSSCRFRSSASKRFVGIVVQDGPSNSEPTSGASVSERTHMSLTRDNHVPVSGSIAPPIVRYAQRLGYHGLCFRGIALEWQQGRETSVY